MFSCLPVSVLAKRTAPLFLFFVYHNFYTWVFFKFYFGFLFTFSIRLYLASKQGTNNVVLKPAKTQYHLPCFWYIIKTAKPKCGFLKTIFDVELLWFYNNGSYWSDKIDSKILEQWLKSARAGIKLKHTRFSRIDKIGNVKTTV